MDKKKILERWGIDADSTRKDKEDWIESYAESIGKSDNNGFSSIFFPMAVKVAAKTIGLDLVSVNPMAYPDYRTRRKAKIERIIGLLELDSET